MNISVIYLIVIVCVLLFILPSIENSRRRRMQRRRFYRLKRKKGEIDQMSAYINEFVDKVCIINCGGFGTDILGTIESVDENWIKVKSDKGLSEIINLEYVRGIKEVPLNAKGKPKSIY